AHVALKAVPSDENLGEPIILTANQLAELNVGQIDEIPVRKIELTSLNRQHFSPELTEISVEANLYPTNNSYHDIDWSVVTDSGVETNIAEIESDDLKVKVKDVGYGNFRVRCTTKNGTDKVKIISELNMEASGLGEAYKDPYDFISGSLYDDHVGEVTSGNERC